MRRVVCDIEANGLENPTKVWCIVCKDIDTGTIDIFRKVTDDERQREAFKIYASSVTLWIGHNFLGYDYPVLHSHELLRGLAVERDVTDTLIISKLADYSREGGHSLEDYGRSLGFPKLPFLDFSKFSEEMVQYCINDVELNHKVYTYHKRFIDDVSQRKAIETEHAFQMVVNDLHTNGFAFNSEKAKKLLEKVTADLAVLDKQITDAFPPRLKLIREITPKETKHGTLSRSDFRWAVDGDLSMYNGGPFCRCEWTAFNPASVKQVVDVLHQAGWTPVDKTKTHIDVEREINHLKYSRNRDTSVDTRLSLLYTKLESAKRYGFKINEENLSTLPPSAPPPARLLAKRILYEARRRTLTEWLGLVAEDGRIHCEFFGTGTWTGRMSTHKPNLQNIPNSHDTQGREKLLGKEMRSLWIAAKRHLLVGVDAEGIQLRILAHMLNDAEFTRALVEGKKDDKTDPHSLNQSILGDACKSRQAAKRFIYALLLGAGRQKMATILECSLPDVDQALNRLMERYTGWVRLKEEVFPKDASRGYIIGLDGRKLRIPGDTEGTRRHLAMSGYLQSGEAIVMKMATLRFYPKLAEHKALLVNFVHDEWQTETPNNMEIAIAIAKMMADALREVGEELKLNCPLAGSYWNDDLKDYTIGTNWSVTH